MYDSTSKYLILNISRSFRLLRHQRVLSAEQSDLHPPVLQVGAQCWHLLQHGRLLQLPLLHADRQPTYCGLRCCLQSELLAQWEVCQLHGSTLAHQVVFQLSSLIQPTNFSFRVSEGKRIRLNIEDFETERRYDFLYITWEICRRNDLFTYNYKYDGTVSQRYLDSPTGVSAVNLHMTSDSSLQKK